MSALKDELPAYEGPLDGKWITEQQAQDGDYRPMEFKGTIVGYIWNQHFENRSTGS